MPSMTGHQYNKVRNQVTLYYLQVHTVKTHDASSSRGFPQTLLQQSNVTFATNAYGADYLHQVQAC